MQEMSNAKIKRMFVSLTDTGIYENSKPYRKK